ncbi:MAG: Uma2 family endonuclease [Candidatus Nealsonbacteria bacterium]|nr:Uma2 family endonuclease [Candidatus Nealsonbacteria bacterium]
MKAVMPDVPPDILQRRKRTGADRWDEMWEGVLHILPTPNRVQQDMEAELETWLRLHWARPLGNKVYHQINLASPGGWPDNYRIPDLVLLTPDRFEIDRNEYFEGPPTVVVEIRSPGDESHEKMPFYAKLGVPEVWIIDRDTKAPQVFVLHDGDYREQSPHDDGWLESPATGIEVCVRPGQKLGIRLAGDASTEQLLPED